LLPRVLLECGVVTDPRLQRGDLIGDRPVDHGFDLGRHVDPRAGHRKAGVAQVHLGCEIRLDMPGRGDLRPRGDGDVAIDLRAGIERLDIHAANLFRDIAAEDTGERERPARRSP
jgi:hypothetical protein